MQNGSPVILVGAAFILQGAIINLNIYVPDAVDFNVHALLLAAPALKPSHHAEGIEDGLPQSIGKPSWLIQSATRRVCRFGRCCGRGFGMFDKPMAEVVDGSFQHARGDIGGLGILIDQQGGGIGFAAGGEIGVFQLAEQIRYGGDEGVKVFD